MVVINLMNKNYKQFLEIADKKPNTKDIVIPTLIVNFLPNLSPKYPPTNNPINIPTNND